MAGLKTRRRRDNGIFYATGTIGGERIRKSLETRDKARAEELCALYEARLWTRHSYGEEAIRTFEEAAVSYLEAGHSSRFTAPIIKHFKGRRLGTINPEEVRDAARKLYSNAKHATWNRQVLVPARAIINHAAGLGWCPKIAIPNFPLTKPLRKSADRDWLDKFLRQADRDGLPHLAACVLFMWQTGTRVSEAVRVMPDDIDLQNRTVLLKKTKGDENVVRHITREIMIRLANLSINRREPVFRYADRFGVYNRMKAVCRRAGIEFLPPHQAGRHSFATNALERGATVAQVMQGGGWKSARMVLEIYAHAENGGKAIAELFDADLAQSDGEVAAKERQHIERKG